MTASAPVSAAAAGTWRLGDLTVNRIGFGAMRLPQTGRGGGTGATSAEPPEVLAVARAHGATPAQVRLAWTVQRGPHVLAIPGTSNPDHLAANVEAGALRLTADEMTRLTSLRGGT